MRPAGNDACDGVPPQWREAIRRTLGGGDAGGGALQRLESEPLPRRGGNDVRHGDRLRLALQRAGRGEPGGDPTRDHREGRRPALHDRSQGLGPIDEQLGTSLSRGAHRRRDRHAGGRARAGRQDGSQRHTQRDPIDGRLRAEGQLSRGTRLLVLRHDLQRASGRRPGERAGHRFRAHPSARFRSDGPVPEADDRALRFDVQLRRRRIRPPRCTNALLVCPASASTSA